MRASAGGGLFGIWCSANPCYALKARGDALSALHPRRECSFPTRPRRTSFLRECGRSPRRRRQAEWAQARRMTPTSRSELTFASNDTSYYLLVAGLPSVAYDPHHVSSKPGAVTAAVHAAGDGSRLLTVHGLHEMTATVKTEDWYPGDVTTEKRFHFVPAAKLLITIPPSNDCLVLRRVDIESSGGGPAGDHLIVFSPPTLDATAGQKLTHQIVARPKKGAITYTLASGPDGLESQATASSLGRCPRGSRGKR